MAGAGLVDMRPLPCSGMMFFAVTGKNRVFNLR